MAKEQTEIFKLLQSLKPVDEKVLADFEREMTEHAIPKIVQDAEMRRTLAAESRHRRLERPSGYAISIDPGNCHSGDLGDMSLYRCTSYRRPGVVADFICDRGRVIERSPILKFWVWLGRAEGDVVAMLLAYDWEIEVL